MRLLSIILSLAFFSNTVWAQKIIVLQSTDEVNAYFARKDTLKVLKNKIMKDTVVTNQNWNKTPKAYLNGPSNFLEQIEAKKVQAQIKTDLNFPHPALFCKFYINKNAQVDSLIIAGYEIISDKGRIYNEYFPLYKNKYNNLFNRILQNYKFNKDIENAYALLININKLDSLIHYQSYLASLPKNTKTIHLENYNLTEFPEELKDFIQLEHLNLSKNMIKKVHVSAQDFPNLKKLNLQNNLIESNNLFIDKKLNIKEINLHDNLITQVPKLPKATKLVFMGYNYIGSLSKKDYKKLKSAEVVSFYGNQLTRLHKNMAKLKNLKEIDLYKNQLTAVPNSIIKLKNLDILPLSNNQLTLLPKKLQQMHNIKTIYAHHNQLSSIPKLPANLNVLDLGYNKIESGTAHIVELKHLRELDLSGNPLKESYDFLKQIPSLSEVYINPSESELPNFLTLFKELESSGVKIK